MPDRNVPAGHEPPDAGYGDGLRDRALGVTLVSRFHGVLRGMRLYDPSNRALLHQQQELLEAVDALMAGEVSLLGMGEYLYVNGTRLRPDSAQVPVFHAVLEEFQRRELGGLRFAAGTTLDELASFLRVFHAEQAAGAADALEALAHSDDAMSIRVIRAYEGDAQAPSPGEGHEAESDHHRARLAFGRAVQGTRDLMQNTARTGRPALQQARRVVQPIVDRLLRRESSLIGLTALKRHDEYTYAHCVNVSILSIRIGQLLGLGRAELADLGVAALLHDTGKLAVPTDVLRKPGRLEPNEWEAIRRHPMEGLRMLSHLPGLSGLMLASMRVAFEHHMNVDHSGYPRVTRARDMSAFSRIVAAADVFDAVTSHRAYRARPMTAHEGLRLLLGREREHFDRAVLWALVRTVGLYPAGTLLRTESARLWISVAPGDSDPRRPVCRELFHGPTIESAPVSADAPLPENERVTHVLAPEDLPVDVETLLAA